MNFEDNEKFVSFHMKIGNIFGRLFEELRA
jgi:hypothetical protein